MRIRVYDLEERLAIITRTYHMAILKSILMITDWWIEARAWWAKVFYAKLMRVNYDSRDEYYYARYLASDDINWEYYVVEGGIVSLPLFLVNYEHNPQTNRHLEEASK